MTAHDLTRFHDAQRGVFEQALRELVAGRKQSHWMWFIFPQIAGLGASAMARRYALSGVDEARAYLADPVLGVRLRQCIEAVLAHRERSAHAIFGSPDDLKFRSCLTLFELAAPDQALFGQALEQFYAGQRDERTIELAGG